MARYEETSRENSFNRYMSSGSSNINIDSDAIAARLRQYFTKPSPPKQYDAPPLPAGADRWSSYWRTYRAPDYTAPVVDARTPQQRLTDDARGGDVTAMWNLGHAYLEGQLGIDKNAQNAQSGIYWLKAAFEHGKAEAGTRLFMYLNPSYKAMGDGFVQKDALASLYWLQKAAAAGDGEAMSLLGDRTLTGAGVDADPGQAVRLFKAASAAGYTLAFGQLEGAYEYGVGVPKDLKEAIKWQREKVRHDVGLYSKPDLVRLLLEDNDPQTNPHRAEIQEVLDSEPDNVNLQILRAQIVDIGLLGEPDPVQCLAICQRIIDRNDTRGGGTYRLATVKALKADHLYQGRGIAKDEIAAYHLYREALAYEDASLPDQSGYYFASLLGGRLKRAKEDATSEVIDEPMTALPLLYNAIRSEKVPNALRAQAALLAAHVLAVHPEAKAAFKGDADQLLSLAERYDSSTTLGIALGLRKGWFGEVNKTKSREMAQQYLNFGHSEALLPLVRWACEDTDGQDPYWQINIENGIKEKNWDAYWWMGVQLTRGEYVPKDLKRAEALLRQAATEGNNAQAQNNLGTLLWRGDLGANREAEGLALLEKALVNGEWMSGRSLAKVYHLGLGVPKDEAKARAFLEKAGAIGTLEAARGVAAAYEKGDIIDADA